MESKSESKNFPSKFQNSEKTSLELQEFCRICLDVSSPNNPLTSPCSCSGSIKYIHDECLKKWILITEENPKNFKCDLCKNPLNMELNSKIVFSCKRLKYEILKILLFPVIFLMFFNFTILIMIFLCKSLTNGKISVYVKFYVLIVLISCVTIEVTVFWKFFEALKNGCFQRKIISWKILEKNCNEGLEYTVFNEIGEKGSGGVQGEEGSEEKGKGSHVVQEITARTNEVVCKMRDRIDSGLTECPSPTFKREDEDD